MSDTEMSALSERAVAFSVESLLGLKNLTSMNYISETTHIDSVPDLTMNSQTSEDSTSLCVNKIEMQLIGRELWSRFHELHNEMIITKSGRRIFPALKVQVNGLDPNSDYMLWIDIIPVDEVRYRYVYHSSRWTVAGSGENPSLNSVYIHLDSPSSGRYWMSQAVVFDKLKLTNSKDAKSKGQISLHSMHKYQPRIHIQKVTETDCNPVLKVNISESSTFIFPETQFITVTAYQNQQITRLKIASNPFAKGFREITKNSNRKLDDNNFTKQYTPTVFDSSSDSYLHQLYKRRGCEFIHSNREITENRTLVPIPLIPTYIGQRNQFHRTLLESDEYSPLQAAEDRFSVSPTLYSSIPSLHKEMRLKSHFKNLYSIQFEDDNLSGSLTRCTSFRDNRRSAFSVPCSSLNFLYSTSECSTSGDRNSTHCYSNNYL